MRLLSFHPKISWSIYLLLGLALLPGRYDWSPPARSTSWRGFLCSAFFFCILIPLISEAFERSHTRPTVRNTLLGAVTLLFCLPYYWVGLNRLFYYRNKPFWLDWTSLPQAPKLVWFPKAFREPTQIPHEFLFFMSLSALLLSGGWWYVRARRNAGKPITKSGITLGACIIVLVLAETLLHLSMHSPYTYICHFEQPPSANHWYEFLLFRNGQGAVNADYHLFLALEQTFMGTPQTLNAQLIRRPFPFYLSSQFTYFFNAYYVMLCFNVAAWIMAAFAIREFVAAHFDRRSAVIAALLTASGPGFIMYVAQPQTYLWGYAVVPLVIWTHWRVCGRSDARLRDYILFGGVLSLALLTYDLLTLMLYFAGYELLFKRSLRKIIVSAVLAIGIYITFGLLTSQMTTFVHDVRNSKQIGESITGAISALHSRPLSLRSYILYIGVLPNYIWNLGNSVFVFPLLVAAAGLFCLSSSLKLKLVGLLFLPSFAGAAFLYLGQTYLATLPRFAFMAYPAVYILCGVALWAAANSLQTALRWKYAAAAVAFCGVAANVLLVNADVFGHPWLYYLFYWEQLTAGNF